MIEDEGGTVKHSEEQSDRPEEIGRVAALDGDEAATPTCLEAQHEGGDERVEVFQYEGDTRSAGCVRPVLVQFDSVDPGSRTGRRVPSGRRRRPVNPASISDWHSSHTRRSNGTDRFCTRMRTPSSIARLAGSKLLSVSCAESSAAEPSDRSRSPGESFVALQGLDLGPEPTVEVDDPRRG